MKAQLYGCFAADKRVSMDVYSKGLLEALQVSGLNTQLFTPRHSLERWQGSRLVMRYLRYVSYPMQLRSGVSDCDVHHVCDHGYAHLHGALTSKRKQGKTVITVHDLIPYLTWKGDIPSEHKPRRPSLNLHSLSFVEKFDHIVTVSENSANDLSEVLDIPRERIDVVPPIIADFFAQKTDANTVDMRNKLGVDDDVELVLISGSEHYKNLEASLRVLRELVNAGRSIMMVKTGYPSTWFVDKVNELGLSENVFTLFLNHHYELADLLASVDCLLFPSWYEGFGMPVAEALACGTGVVTSNRASLREVGGELALYADPDDITSLCQHVVTCLEDQSLRRRIKENGPDWVSQFRAPVIAEKMTELYRR